MFCSGLNHLFFAENFLGNDTPTVAGGFADVPERRPGGCARQPETGCLAFGHSCPAAAGEGQLKKPWPVGWSFAGVW